MASSQTCSDDVSCLFFKFVNLMTNCKDEVCQNISVAACVSCVDLARNLSEFVSKLGSLGCDKLAKYNSSYNR